MKCTIFLLQQSYEAMNTGQKVTLLFNALTTERESINEEGRQLAAVMLRRVISAEFEGFFTKVITIFICSRATAKASTTIAHMRERLNAIRPRGKPGLRATQHAAEVSDSPLLSPSLFS